MRAMALIPARGGSKRLPGKNVADFHGRPMLAYTLDAARQTGLFETVAVSTEDDGIARIAEAHGATLLWRSPRLATDQATVTAVCLDALEREAAAGRVHELFACLYATSPLRSAQDIRDVAALIGPDCDFAMAVTAFHLPPHQALRRQEDGSLAPMWPDHYAMKSQEIGPLVVDNGSTYVVSVPAFLRARTFYGPGLRGHVMPWIRSVDIDTAEELAMAKAFATLTGIA